MKKQMKKLHFFKTSSARSRKKNGISIEKNTTKRTEQNQKYSTTSNTRIACRTITNRTSFARKRTRTTNGFFAFRGEGTSSRKGENIRKGFQTLLSWGLEEYPNEQEVSQIREIKNLAGKNIIQAVQDDFLKRNIQKRHLLFSRSPKRRLSYFFFVKAIIAFFSTNKMQIHNEREYCSKHFHTKLHTWQIFREKHNFQRNSFEIFRKHQEGKNSFSSFLKNWGKKNKTGKNCGKTTFLGTKKKYKPIARPSSLGEH